MLEKQKDFIRVHPDSFYEEITTPQLKKEYERIDSPIDPNEDKAVSLLKHSQRKRTLVLEYLIKTGISRKTTK